MVVYLVQPRHSVSSVFEHYHGLVVPLMPRFRLGDHAIGDHFQFARVHVPRVVTVEAYYVQVLAALVFLRVYKYNRVTKFAKKNKMCVNKKKKKADSSQNT